MSQTQRRRVVITGLGVLSPIGNDVPTFWDAALRGANGIETQQEYVDAGLTTTMAGRLKGFDAEALLGDRKYVRQTDPFVHFAVIASQQALDDSKLDRNKVDMTRVGAIIGSGIGGLEEIMDGNRTLIERGPRRINPFFIPKLMLNAASGNVAIRFGLKGPNFATASACASANHALGMALRTIQYGDADVILSGGAEAACTVLGLAGFCAARAMSTRNDDPAHASRPFDKERDGFVMGEGAGVLVFEELEHAKARGAHIYCEVAGFGQTDDAFHMTSPSEDGEGAMRSMLLAVKDSGATPEDVTYINAHGTSTEYNDRTETLAVKKAFGDHARKLMISSTKSMVGHLLGASGAVELVATAMAIKNGMVPPTRNLTVPDPDCDLDYVPHEGRSADINVALSNSFGFGGHNATVALRKFKD
ncbi:MAG: beta-ketoacyl-ACP synthase II [Planctomycetes bacterium]|nr:beta-ketoacyl-ACP synthase II [Planctomycetota bacterium]MCB9934719.1 beta-ketoacyl-ACP synthase II [Planctomycetota bacterium]